MVDFKWMGSLWILIKLSNFADEILAKKSLIFCVVDMKCPIGVLGISCLTTLLIKQEGNW